MDNLTTTPQAGETCLSTQELHVYRHVDIEKLKSKATHVATTLDLGGARFMAAFQSSPCIMLSRLKLQSSGLAVHYVSARSSSCLVEISACVPSI